MDKRAAKKEAYKYAAKILYHSTQLPSVGWWIDSDEDHERFTEGMMEIVEEIARRGGMRLKDLDRGEE
jgi:hypothetical protein